MQAAEQAGNLQGFLAAGRRNQRFLCINIGFWRILALRGQRRRFDIIALATARRQLFNMNVEHAGRHGQIVHGGIIATGFPVADGGLGNTDLLGQPLLIIAAEFSGFPDAMTYHGPQCTKCQGNYRNRL